MTKNAGLQAALDHLIATNDDPEPTTASEAAAIASATDDVADEAGESLAGVEAEAKSLTCIECGKQFRSHALASYHGEKSGHSQFEESTAEIAPLSEQEKAVKLEELRMRMLEKKKINVRSFPFFLLLPSFDLTGQAWLTQWMLLSITHHCRRNEMRRKRK